jgi:carboxymethylenebutenolidase
MTMTHRLIYLSIFCLALLFACGARQDGGQSADMEQMAEDEAFKAAHEKPSPLQFEGRGQTIDFATPDGKRGSAYAMLNEAGTDKYLFVIHEWWGLNDNIKAEAERLFDQLDNVAVLALDLYDGETTDDADEAGKLMQAVDPQRAEAIIKGALAHAGPDARIGTIGWCFGGGWSLRASILAGEQGKACVMYYGMPVNTAKDIAPLRAPVLGIFATQDNWINPELIGKFEDLAKATNKELEVKWFEADHAFANPSGARYQEEAAQAANQLVWNFLKERL